jgi:hypothetical protein
MAGLALLLLFIPQQSADDKKIAALIERLGSDDIRERERATTELAALGVAIKPKLEAALAGAAPEVAAQIRKVLDNFGWEERFQSALPPVVRLTLEKKKRTPEEIFALIRDKTGWTIRAGAMNIREPVELGWIDAPVLQIIDDVCRALGRGRAFPVPVTRSSFDHRPERQRSGDRSKERVISIDGSQPLVAAAAYSQQFRAEVSDITITETRDYQTTKVQANLQLQLTAQPGTKVVRTGRWIIDELVDERGNSLKLDAPAMGREPDLEPGESRTQVSFGPDSYSYSSFGSMVPFTAPGGDIRKIARLKARIRLTVPGREVVETVKVADLKNGGEIRIGEAVIVILKAEKQNQNFTLNYRIDGKALGRPNFEPLDESGRPLASMGGGSGGGGASWHQNWHLRGEDVASLQVRATVGLLTFEVPIEMTDIVLPKGE